MNKIRHVKIVSPVMLGAPMSSTPNVSFSSENYCPDVSSDENYYTGTELPYRIPEELHDTDWFILPNEPVGFIQCQYCGVDNNTEDIYCVGCAAPVDHSREEAEDVQSET
jgi:hypothetical protein